MQLHRLHQLKAGPVFNFGYLDVLGKNKEDKLQLGLCLIKPKYPNKHIPMFCLLKSFQ